MASLIRVGRRTRRTLHQRHGRRAKQEGTETDSSGSSKKDQFIIIRQPPTRRSIFPCPNWFQQHWIPRSARKLFGISPATFGTPISSSSASGPPPRAANSLSLFPSRERNPLSESESVLQRHRRDSGGLRERSSIKIAVRSPRRMPSIVSRLARTPPRFRTCRRCFSRVAIEYDLRTGLTSLRGGRVLSCVPQSWLLLLSFSPSWPINWKDLSPRKL